MMLLVDTSVWSLAFRRDSPIAIPEVATLTQALTGPQLVATTGLIIQELLQGMLPSTVRAKILASFASLEYIEPTFETHVNAADVRNTLRTRGVQVGTIDAVIIQLAIESGHTLLTTDQDFHHAAEHLPLRLWRP